jgi:16S rRNA (adenine1518-N6/adenine1519-N6)-dimethyltransferase
MEYVRAKKHLGQHFLTDLSVAKRLADIVHSFPNKQVLEIGPGMGVLTQYLHSDRTLKVIEIDHESVHYLASNDLLPIANIIQGDFLKYDIYKIYTEPFILCGNYPYNISSQIVFKMLENRDQIPFMTGMFQYEMAKRIAAGPNNKDYGIISVLTQAFYTVQLEFAIEPSAFNPPPKVRSAVISCKRNDTQDLGCDEKLFFNVVKTGFGQRRKMLSNSIGKFNVPKELLLQNEFAKLRAENLSVADFVKLTLFISNNQIQQ